MATGVCVIIIFYIVISFIWGIAVERVGESKGYENCFWWGFFLGIIGLIVVACLKDNTTTSSNADNIDVLYKLQKLKENGAISEAEYEISKDKILNKL